MAAEPLEESTLALKDYLDVHRVAFNPLLNRNSSDLDRCIHFFESVTSSKAGITSHTNSNDTDKFMRDMRGMADLETLEEMRAIIQEWDAKFHVVDDTFPMDVSGDAKGDDAMDVDTPRPQVAEGLEELPRVAGAKRPREPSEEVAGAEDAIDPELLLEIAGVERGRQGDEDDIAWKEQVPPPNTRAETARRLEEAQPTRYLAAEKVIESAAFKSLKRRVRKDLKELVSKGMQYWPSFKADPNLWKDCDSSVQEHVNSLNIPTVPSQTDIELPDLLLYRLGCLGESGPGASMPPLDPEMEGRLKPILDDTEDCSLKNAAGVGKTRMLFELLSRRFGIYINFAHNTKTNPYGSHDAATARRLLEFGKRNVHGHPIYFQPTVKGFGPSEDDARRDNENIVGHLYGILILARVLVFDWFLELYAKQRAIDESAIRLWCMLQVRPQLHESHDVFDEVFRSLLMVEDRSCEDTIITTLRSCQKRGGSFNFIVLDEVHVPVAEFPTAFPTFTRPATREPEKTRPLLKAVLLAIRNKLDKVRVLVAATEFNDAIINEAIGSTSLKPAGETRELTNFGDYSESSAISHVLVHFFGSNFVSGISSLMRDHIDFWLAGRRRYLCTFIQWVLHEGPNKQSMLNVLRNLVDCATGSKLYAGKYTVIPGFSYRPMIPERLRQKEVPVAFLPTRQKLQHAITYFIVKGIFPAWGDGVRQMVTLGLGRFIPDPDKKGKEIVVIKESLVLMALMHWLIGSDTGETTLKSFLDQGMANLHASSRGYAFEDLVMFILWQAFTKDSGTRLDSVFNFRYLPPTWKNDSGRLIQIFKKSSPSGKTYPLSAGITTRIGYAAQSAKETRAWFSEGDVRRARIPFLQPDKECGPDLMFGLLMKRTRAELLVAIQCKCWSSTHYKGDVLKAVRKVAPEGFYSSKRKDDTERNERNRKRFLKALEQFGETEDMPMPATVGNQDPKLAMIRVLATFDSSVAWPVFDEKYGDYPIASLSDDFLKSATLEFSALERAYDVARKDKGPTSLL